MARAGQVGALVLFLRAHIEQVGGQFVVRLPSLQSVMIDRREAEVVDQLVRLMPGRGKLCCGQQGQSIGRHAAVELEACQTPSLGSVA